MTQSRRIRWPHIRRSKPWPESRLATNKQLTFRELIDCRPRVRVAQVAAELATEKTVSRFGRFLRFIG